MESVRPVVREHHFWSSPCLHIYEFHLSGRVSFSSSRRAEIATIHWQEKLGIRTSLMKRLNSLVLKVFIVTSQLLPRLELCEQNQIKHQLPGSGNIDSPLKKTFYPWKWNSIVQFNTFNDIKPSAKLFDREIQLISLHHILVAVFQSQASLESDKIHSVVRTLHKIRLCKLFW